VAYPFYLGENFNLTAASRDLVGFSNLVQRNVDVILNTPGERATVRKLRVSAMISLVVRAVYRTGAEPEKIQELGINCYKKHGSQGTRRPGSRGKGLQHGAEA
jgi:hypothetical protein